MIGPVHSGALADFLFDPISLGGLIGAGISLGLSAVAVYFGGRLRSAQADKPLEKEGLADRVETLRANLKQSASIMDEINAELGLRTTALDRIRKEAEENRRLAALHADEAEAVKNLVASTIEGAQAQAGKPAKRQQWLFFLAGLFFSIPLGVGVNFLYDLIAH